MAAFLALSAPAAAHEADPSARQLLLDCSSEVEKTRSSCERVVALTVALIGEETGRALCRPATEAERVQPVLQWIEARPEIQEEMWTEAVEAAVRDLWTCPGDFQ